MKNIAILFLSDLKLVKENNKNKDEICPTCGQKYVESRNKYTVTETKYESLDGQKEIDATHS